MKIKKIGEWILGTIGVLGLAGILFILLYVGPEISKVHRESRELLESFRSDDEPWVAGEPPSSQDHGSYDLPILSDSVGVVFDPQIVISPTEIRIIYPDSMNTIEAIEWSLETLKDIRQMYKYEDSVKKQAPKLRKS